ncbi:MAG TPA: hypothetical protein VF215_12460 [Thermoanaerobaculia bacterium]
MIVTVIAIVLVSCDEAATGDEAPAMVEAPPVAVVVDTAEASSSSPEIPVADATDPPGTGTRRGRGRGTAAEPAAVDTAPVTDEVWEWQSC